jgi:sugar phosphate isomerase/epimerase
LKETIMPTPCYVHRLPDNPGYNRQFIFRELAIKIFLPDMSKIIRKQYIYIITFLKLCLVLLLCSLNGMAQENKIKVNSPFFVFNNGISDTAIYKAPAAQVQLAAQMGFDGVEKNQLENFDAFYQAVNDNHLKLYTVYVKVDLDDEQAPYDRRLEDAFKKIQGTQAMPWLFVTSKKYKPSSAENDSIAVPILQEIADLANQYGLKVALYPHTWFWLETVEDAIRVAGKVNRSNFGLTFNLPHFLATQYYAGQDPLQTFPSWAKKASPYLFALSVNGASYPPASADRSKLWESLIQPLGEGNFDTYAFLKTFWDMGFTGPVGLQCYNIKQDKTTHLKKSVQTWQTYKKRYAAGK